MYTPAAFPAKPNATPPTSLHSGASTSFSGFANSVFSKDTVKWSKKTASRLGGAIKTAASSAHVAATNAQAAASQAAALHRQRSISAAQAKPATNAPASAYGPVPAPAQPLVREARCNLLPQARYRWLGHLAHRLLQDLRLALLQSEHHQGQASLNNHINLLTLNNNTHIILLILSNYNNPIKPSYLLSLLRINSPLKSFNPSKPRSLINRRNLLSLLRFISPFKLIYLLNPSSPINLLSLTNSLLNLPSRRWVRKGLPDNLRPLRLLNLVNLLKHPKPRCPPWAIQKGLLDSLCIPVCIIRRSLNRHPPQLVLSPAVYQPILSQTLLRLQV
ncbi:hypothetical protein NEMBOFW57_004770 [Staphylotrichum longicolle]|uniref:Uncharacterized protein n=1 Tax=Staphylotrichum longicolle TaxID=669026 RepID=A0AAD4HZK8_9PEZI|nr:hypothetical protein NEMBOFW57_004770 [Staphylotrichum longicolle]